jgi:hypothetical protein
VFRKKKKKKRMGYWAQKCNKVPKGGGTRSGKKKENRRDFGCI